MHRAQRTLISGKGNLGNIASVCLECWECGGKKVLEDVEEKRKGVESVMLKAINDVEFKKRRKGKG